MCTVHASKAEDIDRTVLCTVLGISDSEQNRQRMESLAALVLQKTEEAKDEVNIKQAIEAASLR